MRVSARQRGTGRDDERNLDRQEEKLREQARQQLQGLGLNETDTIRKMTKQFGKDFLVAYTANTPQASPSNTSKAGPSPKKKLDAVSGRSSSSLSEASPLPSPSVPSQPPHPPRAASVRASSADSSSSSDSHQPPPAASIAHFQTFGPNPLTFDDPTVYEVRAVTDDMTDEEKKETYCVSSFPHDDLHSLIAGTPPNKDFSHVVKPSNQVLASTFTTYAESYLRPLKEEDIGFLQERVRSTVLTQGHV